MKYTDHYQSVHYNFSVAGLAAAAALSSSLETTIVIILICKLLNLIKTLSANRITILS